MIRLDIDLTTEQEFELKALEYRLANMDEQEAKRLLLQASRLLLLRENLIKSLIRHLTGAGSGH